MQTAAVSTPHPLLSGSNARLSEYHTDALQSTYPTQPPWISIFSQKYGWLSFSTCSSSALAGRGSGDTHAWTYYNAFQLSEPIISSGAHDCSVRAFFGASMPRAENHDIALPARLLPYLFRNIVAGKRGVFPIGRLCSGCAACCRSVSEQRS